MRLATRALYLTSTASLALGPVLMAQGRAVRRNTPQLPGAAGPTEGLAEGHAPALRLIVLGESTVAGVGAATHAEALAGRTAEALAVRVGRAVAWRAEGQTGITASGARRTLVPALPPASADVALLALGVNDTLRLRGPASWAADLTALIAALRERVGPVPVFLAAVPPMGRFPALPQPLRATLGLRARLLDATAAELAPRLARVAHLSTTLPITPAMFCADGFHPGPEGYRLWGALLAAGIVDALRLS
jgi:lysophospholipase L1-like esterase